MKIEIEYEEVERLKKEIAELTTEVNELKNKLSLVDEENVKDRAITIARDYSNKYLKGIFKKLGFNTDDKFYTPIESGFISGHIFSENWWDNNDITIEPSAQILGEFKTAYLKIGVITE